jgi:hypothetical protein
MYANKSDEKYFDDFIMTLKGGKLPPRIVSRIKLILFGYIERSECCVYGCNNGFSTYISCKNRGFKTCGLRDHKDYNYGVLYDKLVDKLEEDKELLIECVGKMRYQQFMSDLTDRTIKYLNSNYTRKQIKDKKRGIIKPYPLDILSFEEVSNDPWSDYMIEVRKTKGDFLCSLF